MWKQKAAMNSLFSQISTEPYSGCPCIAIKSSKQSHQESGMTEIEQYPVSQDTFDRQPDEVKRYLRVADESHKSGALQATQTRDKIGARPIGLPKIGSKAILPSMTEQELQDSIIELAQRLGWRVHAERAAWTSKGYRTPIQGDAGFVDLVLAKPGRPLIFAECKSDKGRLSPEQLNWGQVLAGATHCYYFVWRPSDWMNDSIKKILEVV